MTGLVVRRRLVASAESVLAWLRELRANHAEPQEVQRMLRHETLRITLETYVH